MSNQHDRQILNSVVNPLLPLGEGVYDDENQVPKDLQDEEVETDQVKWVNRVDTLSMFI